MYTFFFVEIDLHKGSDENFVQEYIANPYLIDKRKFDIGVYTVLTSIDPLRVYVYDQEVLIRLFLWVTYLIQFYDGAHLITFLFCAPDR